MNDDEGKRRADLLTRGELSEADISANDAADALALQGADLHKFPPGIMWTLADSRHVTMMTQWLILSIWKRFENPEETADAYPDDDFEMQELERVMHEQQYADDADAFGLVDMNGHDLERVDVQGNGIATGSSAAAGASSDTHSIAEVAEDDVSDFKVQVSRPIDFGAVVTATASVTLDDDKSKLCRRRVPFEFWAVFIAWIEQIQWSLPAGDDAASKRGRTCSWAELAIAFRCQAGFSFGDLDLASAANIVAVAVRRIGSLRPAMLGALRNFPSCHSTMSAVGFYLPGVNWRPVFDAQVWQHVFSHRVEVCR